MSGLTWDEGNGLIAELGSERYLKGPDGRICTERKARGWSQERLSKELADVGCPVHQSAISKIEGATNGRTITLDELIGFSKVFDIPVGELLLPTAAMTKVQYLQDLAAGPRLRRELDLAQSRYDALLDRVAAFAASNMDLVREHLEAIFERHKDQADSTDSIELRFAHDVESKIKIRKTRKDRK